MEKRQDSTAPLVTVFWRAGGILSSSGRKRDMPLGRTHRWHWPAAVQVVFERQRLEGQGSDHTAFRWCMIKSLSNQWWPVLLLGMWYLNGGGHKERKSTFLSNRCGAPAADFIRFLSTHAQRHTLRYTSVHAYNLCSSRHPHTQHLHMHARSPTCGCGGDAAQRSMASDRIPCSDCKLWSALSPISDGSGITAGAYGSCEDGSGISACTGIIQVWGLTCEEVWAHV